MCRQAPTCLSLAAWCAVQEAAKQCVAARLRTHHGGPAQTLAALEHSLQAAAGRLQQEPGPALAGLELSRSRGGGPSSDSGASQQRQAAVLLLLFVHALEQGIASASSGCTSRAAPPQAAAAFFAANRKVRWHSTEHTLVRAQGLQDEASTIITCSYAPLVSSLLAVPVIAVRPAGLPGLVCPRAPSGGARRSCRAAA